MMKRKDNYELSELATIFMGTHEYDKAFKNGTTLTDFVKFCEGECSPKITHINNGEDLDRELSRFQEHCRSHSCSDCEFKNEHNKISRLDTCYNEWLKR